MRAEGSYCQLPQVMSSSTYQTTTACIGLGASMPIESRHSSWGRSLGGPVVTVFEIQSVDSFRGSRFNSRIPECVARRDLVLLDRCERFDRAITTHDSSDAIVLPRLRNPRKGGRPSSASGCSSCEQTRSPDEAASGLLKLLSSVRLDQVEATFGFRGAARGSGAAASNDGCPAPRWLDGQLKLTLPEPVIRLESPAGSLALPLHWPLCVPLVKRGTMNAPVKCTWMVPVIPA
jgi:hypothetical protein